MKNVAKGIFILVALFFLATALMLMFAPGRALEHMLVGQTDAAGALSSVRALWGGAIFAVGLNFLIGAIKEDLSRIQIGVIFTLTIIVMRLFSLIVDGSFDGFVGVFVPPIVVFILMLVGHKLLADHKEG